MPIEEKKINASTVLNTEGILKHSIDLGPKQNSNFHQKKSKSQIQLVDE